MLAYAFAEEVGQNGVEAGLARVERWYGRRWGRGVEERSTGSDRLGMRLWQLGEEPCRWPGWAGAGAETVATVQVPVGYRQLVGDVALRLAPVALARRLHRDPAAVAGLTAPFVLARLDETAGSLDLWTDGLGVGRLYELRTVRGTFWSNRPLAALLFAGVRAVVDPLGWRRMAACDWAMGELTPYRDVHAVGAGTWIRVDRSGRRQQSLDVLSRLVAARRDPLAPDTLDDVAGGLMGAARSVAQLWPGVPLLSLSGGRDSRLVAAAFVAAGLDVRLKTNGAVVGEAETARELVRRLGHTVEHEVGEPAAHRPGRPADGALLRARQWHDMTEGMRPAVYLPRAAPRVLIRQRGLSVGGVGGEFGHAPGYPDDVERLERLEPSRRQRAFVDALRSKIVLPRGIARQAEDDVEAQIDKVLSHAAARSASDAKALDWFYADERLRRWGMAGESHGVVLPLLAPEFVSAAFGLSTAGSRASALHHALIERLVPAWASVPFFSATLKQRGAVHRPPLWHESDADLLTRVVDEEEEDWGDGFDVAQVQKVWRAALDGRSAARDELLMQRVVWRAAFTDHLSSVNAEAGPRRRPLIVDPAPEVRPPGRPRLGLVRRLAIKANDVPLARRLARTSVGRLLRRRIGV